MICFRDEGASARNGLNVYGFSDSASKGGVFRVGNFVWRIRFSTRLGRWFFGFSRG